MSINLNKASGKAINLTKHDDSLKNVQVVLWWKAPPAYPKYDLDLSAFGLGNTPAGPKLIDENWFIFFNNETPDHGFIVKSPDARDDVGEERIDINIAGMPSVIDEISLIVTIWKGDERKQTFGKNAKGEEVEAGLKILNKDTGEEIAFYDLDAQFTNETAVQIGSLYRNNGEFTFQAIGQGYHLGIGDFLNGYAGDNIEIEG